MKVAMVLLMAIAAAADTTPRYKLGDAVGRIRFDILETERVCLKAISDLTGMFEANGYRVRASACVTAEDAAAHRLNPGTPIDPDLLR